MALADKLIGSGPERSDAPDPLRTARNHLLGLERGGIEFLRHKIGTHHREHDPFAGRNMQFGRLKLVAADGNAGAENVLGPCGRMARRNDKQGREHARRAAKPCAHSVDVFEDRFLKTQRDAKSIRMGAALGQVF
jgi:hypothetical protein